MPVSTGCDVRRRYRSLLAAAAVAVLWIDDARSQPAADPVLVGGLVHDGSGQPPVRQDIGLLGERISFVGDAAAAGLDAALVVDVHGLMVTPGFIDMHSHAELAEDYGRDALPFLRQGITTVAIGVDGRGTPDISEAFAGIEGHIGVNAFAYVGHGEIRERVIGPVDRAPSAAELDEMRALVRQAMNEGAFGLSTGLFYLPGYYATTAEVIELARVAAAFDGIYDTHDRDLGATYRGIGYLDSIREAIRIGEAAGARVVFSHFNAQGASNYGRAPEGGAPDRRGPGAGCGGGGGAARLHCNPVELGRLCDTESPRQYAERTVQCSSTAVSRRGTATRPARWPAKPIRRP